MTYKEPQRVSYPLDEAVHPWLKILLDAYYETDLGVREGIARETGKGKQLACARGCAHCCRTHEDIPVFPIELVGMTWYAVEQVQGPVRAKLRQQLQQFPDVQGCPFLVEDVCSIHALRPMACRQFNVFNQACAPGEDAYHTRRQDVLTPIRSYKENALQITVPFYGKVTKSEQKQLVQSGKLDRLARAMRDCQWQALADKMDQYDRRKG